VDGPGARAPIRFPRIVRLRPDKRAEEADTLETVTGLYEKIASR
jgi:ATP-dependent DNA ligase